MFNFIRPRWRYVLAIIIVIDLLVVSGLGYFFTRSGLAAIPTIAPTQVVTAPSPTATIKPWEGPPRPSPTATRPWLPPTPLSTLVLADSGFPPGFTPTPRPTREPVYISFPQIFPTSGQSVDVPVVSQVLYPESFFAPGTNSACGPVALYAAMYGLGLNIDYTRLRDIAVANGFGATGISKWGMVNTILTLNNELGNPATVEYNDQYTIRDLIKHLRQHGVVIVLVQVYKENGQYHLTNTGAIGHFLLVESIRGNRVQLAGSTLGMDAVTLSDFTQSWTQTPPDRLDTSFSNDHRAGWALVLKRAQ